MESLGILPLQLSGSEVPAAAAALGAAGGRVSFETGLWQVHFKSD